MTDVIIIDDLLNAANAGENVRAEVADGKVLITFTYFGIDAKDHDETIEVPFVDAERVAR